MSMQRHYSRAPITEALIDLRVQFASPPALETLLDIQGEIENDYPAKRDIEIVQAELAVGAEVGGAVTGYAFVSKDERQVCQVRVDGFTFNRLAPYERWESFRNEAQRLWRVYHAAVQPTSVIRAAVRTVNRLDLPGPSLEFKDYLRTSPELSADLPQDLSGYFMQLQVPLHDIKCTLLLNQALIPPPDPMIIPVILDIDIVRSEEIPGDEIALWNLFEQLHVRRNEVFEACITENTRELIR